MIPKVALVGRPNVGKSTLFNRLLGERRSIVEKTPGVTRDYLEARCDWCGKSFTLVDTGGMAESRRLSIGEKILEKVDEAIKQADLILFVVDAKDEILLEDKEVAQHLRRKKGDKPVLLVANKVETQEEERSLSELYALGFGDPFPVSALHGKAAGDLLDEIVKRLRETDGKETAPFLKLCVAGRPNVGKSSLVNAILGESRVIVHEEPGTTRDAVDTLFSFDEKNFLLADTAGLRKRAKAKEAIEFYSRTRTIKAILRSDVVLLVLEAPNGVMAQDKHIAGEIEAAGKGIVILANKWDLLPSQGKKALRDFTGYVQKELPFVSYAPVISTSAVARSGIDEILSAAIAVFRSWRQQFNSEELKKILSEILMISPPPSVKRGKTRIKSLAFLGSSPPTFLLKTQSSAKVPGFYMRFIEGKLREAFDLRGTPIRIKLQTMNKRESG